MYVFKRVLEQWARASGPCRGCPLRGGDVVPYYAIGNWSSPIMFVGSNPGDERPARSRRTFRQFHYDASIHARVVREVFWNWADTRRRGTWGFASLFDQVLRPLGLTRRDIYYTNACKCAFGSNAPGKTDEATRRCQKYLGWEIEAVKPKLIVTFGQEAAASVRLRFGLVPEYGKCPRITELHGSIEFHRGAQPVILHLLHWSNADRNMQGTRDRGSTYRASVRGRIAMAFRAASLNR